MAFRGGSLRAVIEEHCMRELAAHGGVMHRAAQAMQISRNTVSRYRKRYEKRIHDGEKHMPQGSLLTTTGLLMWINAHTDWSENGHASAMAAAHWFFAVRESRLLITQQSKDFYERVLQGVGPYQTLADLRRELDKIEDQEQLRADLIAFFIHSPEAQRSK